MAVYGQDDWGATKRLTLNLGLRWEYFGPPHNFQPGLDSNLYFGPATTPIATTSTNQFFPVNNPFFAQEATATFQQVLAKYPEQPRALYGLAVASVLQGEVDQAKDLFQRVVAEPAVDAGVAAAAKKDPLIVAWSHVYLGRIYDVGGERELAVSEYRAALAVPGAPETALQAARRGMEKGYERGTRNP